VHRGQQNEYFKESEKERERERDFICSINFRFLNEIKENSVSYFDLLQFNKLF
jgi:hypothetical protein